MSRISRYAKMKSGVTANLPGDPKKHPKVAPKPKEESPLEAGFLRWWLMEYPDLPAPEREYPLPQPPWLKKRRQVSWRLDFAWPAEKVFVEIEGGMFKGHGHQRGRKYTDNCRKYNVAVMRGWRLLRYTTIDMDERPLQVVVEVAELVTQRSELCS